MTNTILDNFLTPRDEREDGFTLIEILVVIIIIGILAAVAIPIFLNQQRTARDSATTSDVRNLATNVETAKVADPEATSFEVGTLAGDTFTQADTITGDGASTFAVKVGDASPIEFSVTDGTVLSIDGTGDGGEYIIKGSNPDGQEYKGGTDGKFREYISAEGGIQ